MKFSIFLILFIAFSAACFSQPNIAKKQFHLFLLAGQSNMAGRGKVALEDTLTNSRIWVLTKNNEWAIAKEPLHFDKPSVVGVGPGFAFAKKMAELDTNIVIGLIPCAVGGSSIDVWQPGKYYEPTNCYPYDDAMKRLNLAMKVGVLKGILWQQGESDSDSLHSKIYSEKLVALVKQFRKEVKIKRVPFLAGTIADFYVQTHPYAKMVNEAIVQLPHQLPKIAVVYTSTLTPNSDNIHLNTASARELGNRYAVAFFNLMKK